MSQLLLIYVSKAVIYVSKAVKEAIRNVAAPVVEVRLRPERFATPLCALETCHVGINSLLSVRRRCLGYCCSPASFCSSFCEG